MRILLHLPAGPRCYTGPLDLVFMIDSSRSVRPFEFETMRQFLVGLLRSLDVGLNATRVGVIQYSSQVQSVFPLGAFSRREDMERAIRAVVPLAQGTMTGLAIQYAMNVAFSEAEGARPSEKRVPRVLVIVTDGRPQDRVAEVAAQARARGIEIYAVGVQRAEVGSLRAMASPPLDQHVFLVESFDLIQEFGLQFQGRLCGELEWRPSSGYADVQFWFASSLWMLLPICSLIAPCVSSGKDLCADLGHGCQHLCVNAPGTFYCACNSGYKLAPDNKNCLGERPPHPAVSLSSLASQHPNNYLTGSLEVKAHPIHCASHRKSEYHLGPHKSLVGGAWSLDCPQLNVLHSCLRTLALSLCGASSLCIFFF